MGAQSTGYEKVASGHPDHLTAYYAIMHSEGEEVKGLDEVIEHLHKRGRGSHGSRPTQHCFDMPLEYEAKLNEFITESENAIQVQVDHIWTVVTRVMEDAGAPVSNGLGIAIHLVDMLPTILAYLAFQTIAPMLTSFAPEVYASKPWLKTNILNLMHTPTPHSNCMAMDVLCDEIVHNLVVCQGRPLSVCQ